jgi:hypothetical protein
MDVPKGWPASFFLEVAKFPTKELVAGQPSIRRPTREYWLNLDSCPLLHILLKPLLVKFIWNLCGATSCEFHLNAREVSPKEC